MKIFFMQHDFSRQKACHKTIYSAFCATQKQILCFGSTFFIAIDSTIEIVMNNQLFCKPIRRSINYGMKMMVICINNDTYI